MHFENLKFQVLIILLFFSLLNTYMKNRKTTSRFMYSIFGDQKEGKRKMFIKILRRLFKDVETEYIHLYLHVPNLKNFYLYLESEEF